jgi:hypothetical protein
MEVNCAQSTITDGSFMVEYKTNGEFVSFIREDAPTHSPIEGEYLGAIRDGVCEDR